MKTIILVFTAFALVSGLLARDHYFVPPGAEIISLASEHTGRDYELLVALPGSYQESPEKRYPTLYLTDAQWDMALVSSIIGKLNYDKALPEIIVVGITYPGANADYGKLRERDLAPTKVEAVNPHSGDAMLFLQFIEETVIPRIESDYRADPEARALGGVSLGGLFSLYAMYEKPQLFRRHIAISPATPWDLGYIFRRDNEYAASSDSLPARLFVAYGGGEYVPYREAVVRYQEKLAAREYQGLELLNWAVEGERHGGVAVEGWIRGLRWVFKDITPELPGPLEDHFKSTGLEIRIVE